jgi:tetratricopeptide (TPR) repeat protein
VVDLLYVIVPGLSGSPLLWRSERSRFILAAAITEPPARLAAPDWHDGGRLHSAEIQRRLLVLTTETAVIAGYVSYHLHNYGDAEDYFGLADQVARDAGDGPLRAMGLIGRSALYSSVPHGGFGGDPQFALALLREAEAAAGPDASPFLLTWLHCRRVEDFASCGEAFSSDRNLQLAARSFSHVRGRDDGFYYDWSAGRLIGYEGSAAVLLKRSEQAPAIVEEPLRRTTARMPSERSFLLIILAAAYADQGEVEQACRVLAEALELAKDAGLSERIRRIKGTRRQHLSRWDTAPCVRDLDARVSVQGRGVREAVRTPR